MFATSQPLLVMSPLTADPFALVVEKFMRSYSKFPLPLQGSWMHMPPSESHTISTASGAVKTIVQVENVWETRSLRWWGCCINSCKVRLIYMHQFPSPWGGALWSHRAWNYGLVASGRLVAPSCRLVANAVGLVAYFTQILGPGISSRFIVSVELHLQ